MGERGISNSRRYSAVSSITIIVIVIIVVSTLGAILIFSMPGKDEKSNSFGADSPEAAFEGWVKAFNSNDWGNTINYSTMHFASSDVIAAHSNSLGNLTSTISFDNLSVISSNDILPQKGKFIEKELSQLHQQINATEFSQFCLVQFTNNVSDQGIFREHVLMYCVMVEIDQRWYRTFIEMNDNFWSNDIWENDWYEPRTISAAIPLNDSNIWKIAIVACPTNISITNLTFDFGYSYYDESIKSTVNWRGNFWAMEGLSQNVMFIHDRMNENDVENNHRHYQVGLIDNGENGYLSIGDYFYIVMDQPNGDNSMLPESTHVTFYISIFGEQNDGIFSIWGTYYV